MKTPDLTEVVEKIAIHLVENQKTMVTAESCTGGGIAFSLTDLPGSSNWFDRAYVTYSNQAKEQMIGVKKETLNAFGAVSEAVAKEMAIGSLLDSQTDYALSVTGVAGPGGGTPEKPVGMVCFGWAGKTKQNREFAITETQYFQGDRQSIRQQTITYSLSCFLQDFFDDS
ncbi:MAG: nicotinamide-nucleotide amidohydrolase family protein [Gammaproteobacteria bacterium]|nr:nicotinamide-nucleotide amidohydrolase family protein [Gammaproteobacteria bacterium]